MPHVKETILIVEDTEINIILLKDILSEDYELIIAEDGEKALTILADRSLKISAVLLDLMLPVMDGFQVLAEMKERGLLTIPVIVMTGETDPETEEKTLNMGAVDYVPKPYNPRILKTRLANAIARSELACLGQIRHMAEHDALTDLFNRNTFFRQVMTKASQHAGEKTVFVRMDIRRFHLINSIFGESTGDSLLIHIADELRKYAADRPWCVYGRIEGDVFCLFMPCLDEGLEDSLEALADCIARFRRDYTISVVFGVYKVPARDYSAENMYVCATRAASSVLADYKKRIGVYDLEMGEQMLKEQEIVRDMKRAIDAGEFIVYYQPKYDTARQLPFGAEALVRWDHKDIGLISPSVFVPVLEKHGFVVELDVSIWEKVCADIRRWIDMGLDPAPISVNMSRADISDPHLTEHLTGLLKKYDLSPDLLSLELTESVYMDNPELMDRALKSLQDAGFTILMDDFGSGYSSLNTLKDISVDILKVDMAFLSGDMKGDRSGKIINAVVQMAHSLDMPVVMEGVETKAQYEFMKAIGCEYIQGFYFSLPLPVKEYEKLIAQSAVKRGVAEIRKELEERYVEKKENERAAARGRLAITGLEDMLFGPRAEQKDGLFVRNPESLYYRDALTGLYNRNYLFDWCFWSEKETGRIAFLLIDLQLFTELMERYGNDEGKRVIKQVASALMQVVTPGNILIRYGGDVFLLIVKQLGDSMILPLVHRIIRILAGLKWKGSAERPLSADFGFSSEDNFERYYHDAGHLDSMLHAAEVRLLYNKDKTRNIRRVVLMAEPADSGREVLHEALRKETELVLVSEVSETLEFLKFNHVDMVIVDTTGDPEESYQLIRSIVRDEQYADVRLIAITDASSEQEMKALREGVDDFITDSEGTELLMHRIRRNLANRSASKRITENHFLFNQIHIPYAVAQLVATGDTEEKIVYSYVNEAFEQEFEKSREDLMQQGLFPGEDLLPLLQEARDAEKSIRKTFREQDSGRYFDLTVYYDGDNYFGMMAFENMHYAVMEKEKQHYEEIRERELMLSNLAENIPGGIAILRLLDEEHVRMDYVSEALVHLLGRKESLFEGQNLQLESIVHPKDLNKLKEMFVLAYRNGVRVNITFRMIHSADGHPIWVSGSGVEIRKENGCPIYYTVFSEIPEEVGSYQQTIEDAPSGIMVFAQDNLEMLYANKLARSFFGRFDDYKGISCPEFMGVGQGYSISHLKEIPRDCYREYELRAPGTDKRLLCQTGRIDWNRRKAYISYIVDDTYRILAREEAIKYEQAKAENRAKTDFMARMSHDLRTPLNAIIGFSDLSSIRTGSRDECEEYFDKIHESGQYLLSLITDILDVSKLEHNKIHIIPRPARLDLMMEEIREVVEPLARAKHLKLTYDDYGKGAAVVLMDHVRVRQVIMNLLSNAVKFTPEGGQVRLELMREDMDDGTLHVSVVVRDTGIGMSQEFIHSAFDAFTQEAKDDDNRGGTGLGLTITKQLVNVMGGTIECESVKDQGTTVIVTFDFPRVEKDEWSEEDLLKQGASLDLTGKRLLLVEDHPMNMQIAKILLEKRHAEVVVARDGQIGVDRFASSSEGYFDGILMDIRMPNMDGLTATREIRKLPRPDAGRIPIIAMTANAYSEDVQKALEAGMDEHLAKPIDPKKLYATLARFFS